MTITNDGKLFSSLLTLKTRRVREGKFDGNPDSAGARLSLLAKQKLLTPAPSHASANGFIREVKISELILSSYGASEL